MEPISSAVDVTIVKAPRMLVVQYRSRDDNASGGRCRWAYIAAGHRILSDKCLQLSCLPGQGRYLA